MEAAEVETRQLLQKLFPKVSFPSNVVREGAFLPSCWELRSCCAAFAHSPFCPKVLQWDLCLLLVVPALGTSKDAKLQVVTSRKVLKQLQNYHALCASVPVNAIQEGLFCSQSSK